MTFLEAAQREYNAMRARHFAGDGYEGVTVAGLALVRADGEPSVFLAQRTFDETDDTEVQETWEFPGGHLNPGEEPFTAAAREFSEEIGFPLPPGDVVGGWRSDNGEYQGFVYEPSEWPGTLDWTPTTEVQAVGWFTREMIGELENLRPEVRDQTDWDMIFGSVSRNEEDETMPDDEIIETDEITEPDLSLLDLAGAPIPVHGVLAPEDIESGDSRGFNVGAVTARPYRLPFMWQEQQNAGHDKAYVVGSVDRLMRKNGLIHWEGALMPSTKASEFTELLAFFGRFGVSVDGDKGNMDAERTTSTNVLWYDAIRAAGLTAVSIPAFAEAYVAFGPHPDMPERDSEDSAVLRASGDMVEFAESFDRGPGWVTNPKETKRLHDYWTKPGQPGYQKIRWGTPGDFRRARVLIGEKIGKNSPEDLKYLNQIIAQWHYDALGYWPGELGKPGNAPATKENKRRAARHASSLEAADDGWEPVLAASGLEKGTKFSIEPLAGDDPIRGEAYCASGCGQAAEYRVSSDDPEWFGLFCVSCAPEHEGKPLFTLDTLSASGAVALPPASYFDRHPDSGALVIDEPDENGIRRTYGYAGEWGVCHIGYDGRCVEMPEDPTGEFADFLLGRTKTNEGYINVGLITYKVEHRDAETILSETAQQAHFDNIKHAWAAVRLGTDERGVWFSGVVLPHVPEEDIVLIEASGQVSGEWRYGSLRGLQCVNIPGFPVVRSSAAYDDDGNVVALVASAFDTGECEPTPAERMAALARVDAETRFEFARSEWAKYKGE